MKVCSAETRRANPGEVLMDSDSLAKIKKYNPKYTFMHTGGISCKLVIKTIKIVHVQSIKIVKLRKFRIECCIFTKKIVSKLAMLKLN